MQPISFEGANVILTKPDNMTDEQCMSTAAYRGIDGEGFHFTLTLWMPNKEDIDAINAGRPICLKVMGTNPVPVSLFTYDEGGKPNI